MIAPPPRRSRGLRKLGVMAVCVGALALVAALAFTRSRSSTAPIPLALPSATVSPEPTQEEIAAPPAEITEAPATTAEPPKAATPKHRPSPSEGTSRRKGSKKR